MESFAIEVSGITGKSEKLAEMMDAFIAKGIDAKWVGSSVPSASVILCDDFDRKPDFIKTAVYGHPRHIVATNLRKHVKPTEIIKLPPPDTELGYLLEIMRDLIRGDPVGDGRKASRDPHPQFPPIADYALGVP